MNTKEHYFMYTIQPLRENFLETVTAEEQSVIGSHFNYLKELYEKGKVLVAARTLNAKLGIVILKTDTEGEAREITDNDPAVKKKIFIAELNPISLAIGKPE